MRKLREVLVINDDNITGFLHSTLLQDMEVSEQIHCFIDPEEALDYIQKGIQRQVYPDLFLLDLHMSGSNGFEFLESLRPLESEEISKFNIVMLSTNISRRDKEIAASFGDLLKGHFLKPLNETLVKKILCLIPPNEGLPKGKGKRLPSAGNRKQKVS